MSKPVYKIAITGPESTGKSTLSAELAKHFNTLWVPEYAREYIGSLKRDYTARDIEVIAKEQVQREKELLKYANRFLFCDTDPLVCHIWHLVKYGKPSDAISKLMKETKYDLILLCDIDMEWEYDPMREHPDKREWLMEKYKSELKNLTREYQLITGNENKRTDHANSVIQACINQ
ncbi:MAG: ATPase [Marinilabiliales bacterium]|nr:MAG: ATPase [Marinilabiliales bacterium]